MARRGPALIVFMGLEKRLTEGVTKRHGFHSNVVVPLHARGLVLQKRARAGHWHRRFFNLNNVYLV